MDGVEYRNQWIYTAYRLTPLCMVDATTWAKVQMTFTGLHQWNGAPSEVRFLSDLHRHEFHVIAKVRQEHDDRDIEYIQLKRRLDEFFEDYGEDTVEGKALGSKSCEMMAKDIIEFLRNEIGYDRHYQVEVLEDGENGALVEADEGDAL